MIGTPAHTPHDCQHAFRALLTALARPGEIVALALTAGCAQGDRERLVEDGDGAIELLCTTLLDGETSFAAAGADVSGLESRILAATGARATALDDADFVVVTGTQDSPVATHMRRGTLQRPELGATVIYGVSGLSQRGTLALRLTGPGIREQRALGVDGFAKTELEALRQSRAAYPLGVDAVLVDRTGAVVALPRSTAIEVL